MPDYYEFLNYPKIISGQCALENIPCELDGQNAQKPLVITSKSLVQRGLAKQFTKAFYDSTVVLGGIYDEVRDYAGISQAREAALLFKARGCDALIALGNGPVVDLAKAVNLLVCVHADHLGSYYEGAIIDRPLKPLMVVPACSFNGWETTPTLTVDNRRIVSEFLYPATVVIDGRMVIGCAPQSLAESGVMALSQALEAMLSSAAHPMLDALAHPALSLLAQHLTNGVRRPTDRGACMAIANAAVMAGAAFCNAPPGMASLLTESLSRATGIGAGQLMPGILWAVMDAQQRDNTPIRDELFLALAGLDRFAAVPAQQRAHESRSLVMDLIHGLRGVLPASLREFRIQRHLLVPVAQEAADKGAGRFTAAQCLAVLTHAVEWPAG